MLIEPWLWRYLESQVGLHDFAALRADKAWRVWLTSPEGSAVRLAARTEATREQEASDRCVRLVFHAVRHMIESRRSK